MLTFGQLATLANARQKSQFKTPRHLILELTAMVGLLASSFLQHAPLDNANATTTTTTTTTATASSPTRPTKTPPTSPNRKLKASTTTPTPPLSPASSTSLLWKPPLEIRLLLGQILFQLAILASSTTTTTSSSRTTSTTTTTTPTRLRNNNHVVQWTLNLRHCIVAKLELNAKKYPVALCKGKSNKYTAYSQHTNITKTLGQDTTTLIPIVSIMNVEDDDDKNNNDPNDGNDNQNKVTTTINADDPKNDNHHHAKHNHHHHDDPQQDTTQVDAIQVAISKFAEERSWERFHTPRNLVLALIGELGELAELYQWKGDIDTEIQVDDDNDDDNDETLSNQESSRTTSTKTTTKKEDEDAKRIQELEKVGQEIADVAIYLLRLASVCRIKIAEYTVEACANDMARKY